jgi:hypothetical protein
MTRVGVAAVTVTAAPVVLPEMMTTGGGVMVTVVSRVTATVTVDVIKMVFVMLAYHISNLL